MIIARSPLRVSFAGGGTDIPGYYEKYGPGIVVSTSIDKHVYVTLTKKFDGKVSVRWRIHENVDNVRELKHPLIRETLLHYGIESGVEIVIISDVPARGSGLGASSALACALVAALERYKTGEDQEKPTIALIAASLEINRVGSPIGKQDHYASAFGGFNKITFHIKGNVEVTPFDSSFVKEIESQSMLFYLDHGHAAAKGSGGFVQKILKDQVAEIEEKHHQYDLQRDNALRMWEHMAYEVPERFMDHVNENWRLKRGMHPDITNQFIDGVVQRAYSAGATAAKVCGAGGGGFVYLMVPESMQDNVRKELSDLQDLRFKFDKKGTEVVFSDLRDAAYSIR